MRAQRSATAALLQTFVLLALGTQASALPSVTYTTTDLGGGVFLYQLCVDNTGGAEPLGGLNVLHGDTVFGLDDTSAVGAPGGWLYFAPVPGLVDDLDYFSLSSVTEIPVGGTLDGFSFESTRDPATLGPTDFAVEGIGGDSATQIDLGYAELVPEPSSSVLLAFALPGLFWVARRLGGLHGSDA
jgi:hypothetical protein